MTAHHRMSNATSTFRHACTRFATFSESNLKTEVLSIQMSGEKMINSKIARPFHKSTFLLLLMALLFALGCGSAPTVIVVLTPTWTFTASPTAGPTQTQVPPSPTPTPTPFVPRAVLKIFVQSPLSGGQASAGTDILRGAELAVLQLSDSLAEQGYKVELASYDDQN